MSADAQASGETVHKAQMHPEIDWVFFKKVSTVCLSDQLAAISGQGVRHGSTVGGIRQ